MKKILILNFLMMSLFNFAHPVTPAMMHLKGSPDYLFGIFFLTMSLGTLYFSPKWGVKIDKIGTKKILTFAPIAYGLGQFIFAYFNNPLLMILGRFISGAFAAGWIVGVTSYINLVSKPEKKIKNFGYQLVAAKFGAVAGQMISGKIGTINVYYSFDVQIISLLILAFIVSLSVDNLYPNKKVVHKANFSRVIIQLKQHGFLLILIAMACMATVNNLSRGIPSYFGSDVANFTTSQVGNMNAFTNALGLLTNLFLIGLLERRFNFFQSFLLQALTAAFGSILIIYAVLTIQTNQYFVIIFLSGLTILTLGSSIYQPFVQKEVVNSGFFEQGEILGVINSFNAIGMLLSGASMSFLYPISPILPFLGMLVFSVLAIIFQLIARSNEKLA